MNASPDPQQAAPPPSPEPAQVPLPRRYVPRAFGFDMHGHFIEVTVYLSGPPPRHPAQPMQYDMEGRFSDHEGAPNPGGADQWTEFTSAAELIAKANWSGEQAQAFLNRANRLMASH